MTQHRDHAARGWEIEAAERPEFAVLTDGRTGDEFYASGEAEIGRLFDALARHGIPAPGVVLDFGCGLGRLSFALSRRCGQVIGIDHAERMLEQARARAVARGIANCRFLRSEGDALPVLGVEHVDLVVSRLVFQHMPTWQLVARNLEDIVRALRPGGTAWLQFDSRPRSPGYVLWDAVERLLPAGIGPSTRRAPLRRYRVRASDLHRLFASLGLRVIDEVGRSSQGHELLMVRG